MTLGIINRIKSIVRSEIVRVFSLTSVSTLVKMCTGLVSMKIIALLVGPAGIALLGQLNNFVSIILSFAGGGINNGITKYTSQYRDNPDRLSRYLSVGLRLTVISGSTIGILLILLAIPLSSVILLNPDYAVVFRIFGFTLLLYAANNFILSVINGFKEF